jgi:antitoxin YefM
MVVLVLVWTVRLPIVCGQPMGGESMTEGKVASMPAKRIPFRWLRFPSSLATLVPPIAQVNTIMRVVNFSEARNNLKQVIEQVVADADVAVISRRDAPDAVVMSLETYNSWLETVYLLKTPANAAHLAKSIEQLRKGRGKERPLADA